MEDYDIDLPAEVVVDWIAEAAKQPGSGLLMTAWREYVVDEHFVPEKKGYEETEVREVTAVGSLEVIPEHRPETWTLHVRVENELRDRLPPDEDVPEEPEEISLETFVEEFIIPRDSTAEIWFSVADSAAKKAFDDFLASLEHMADPKKG